MDTISPSIKSKLGYTSGKYNMPISILPISLIFPVIVVAIGELYVVHRNIAILHNIPSMLNRKRAIQKFIVEEYLCVII
jgi:hypothetical protein